MYIMWCEEEVAVTASCAGVPHGGSLRPRAPEFPVSRGCCATSSCSPSPGDWRGSCWTGTAQGTSTAHHRHPQGFGQAVPWSRYHQLPYFGQCGYAESLVSGVALWSQQSLWSQKNLRFDTVLQASQSQLM